MCWCGGAAGSRPALRPLCSLSSSSSHSPAVLFFLTNTQIPRLTATNHPPTTASPGPSPSEGLLRLRIVLNGRHDPEDEGFQTEEPDTESSQTPLAFSMFPYRRWIRGQNETREERQAELKMRDTFWKIRLLDSETKKHLETAASDTVIILLTNTS